MSDAPSTPEQVQAIVGKLATPRDLKVIDHLDSHAQRWIAASPLLYLTLGQDAAIAITLGGGPPGFVQVADQQHLLLPLTLLDDSAAVRPGAAFGTLFLVSGMNETLRINGQVLAVEGDQARLQVHECFLHCAKALLRSDFWQAAAAEDAPSQPQDFLAASRFMALATLAADGSADLSPKGDPAGRLLQAGDQHVCFADRPGNRRIDSFRNIVSQPQVALLALIPGCAQVVEVCGSAALSTSDSLRADFRVQDATPKLVTRVSVDSITLRHSPALEQARLWPAATPPAGLNGADIFKAHIQLNRTRGVAAKLARTAISIPGALEKGLREDYKKNLY
ncbi:pyridoxamine 5'-phosphate oxidase family protein [Halopseudomonas maritima]|uniref:pyridoxamine 5'-phosphate oxidase family protein n=1 Tax=Halopseudomonas maritima TaxID=2918528 RepID=UPI001EEB66EA|nr:pyridoxamine 5'-phosphate oxidase family protein [Halopseudomonas maritima]UJJ32743.1 pyridoxamine 5'-phosphate oxidase family protein [Halopseudomonas maritima]